MATAIHKTSEGGAAHQARRIAQDRAAARHLSPVKAAKHPGKGNRNRWKRELGR